MWVGGVDVCIRVCCMFAWMYVYVWGCIHVCGVVCVMWMYKKKELRTNDTI